MRCLNDDFQANSVFYIFNHATDDQLLFYDDQDYEFFLIALGKQLDNIPASIIAFCLMPNHYHFLIRQDSESKIYKIFNYAFVSYARYYNRKYERKGHIFRSPLQHKKVSNQLYLIQLCKYIHLNPVYAGLVEEPEEWEYSNYKKWINQRDELFFTKDIRNKYFHNTDDYILFLNSLQNFIKHGTFIDIITTDNIS